MLVRNEVNAAWCAATLLYFLICLGRLEWRVLPIRRALRRVVAPLADVDKTSFASRFEDYEKTVLAQRSLEHPWREFDESLVKPTEGEAQVIRNTHQPTALARRSRPDSEWTLPVPVGASLEDFSRVLDQTAIDRM